MHSHRLAELRDQTAGSTGVLGLENAVRDDHVLAAISPTFQAAGHHLTQFQETLTDYAHTLQQVEALRKLAADRLSRISVARRRSPTLVDGQPGLSDGRCSAAPCRA